MSESASNNISLKLSMEDIILLMEKKSFFGKCEPCQGINEIMNSLWLKIFLRIINDLE